MTNKRQRDAVPTADAGGAFGGMGGGMGGMPDLSSLAGMMGGMGGGGGGAGGLSGLMSNPGFMQMAQSMMHVRACLSPFLSSIRWTSLALLGGWSSHAVCWCPCRCRGRAAGFTHPPMSIYLSICHRSQPTAARPPTLTSTLAQTIKHAPQTHTRTHLQTHKHTHNKTHPNKYNNTTPTNRKSNEYRNTQTKEPQPQQTQQHNTNPQTKEPRDDAARAGDDVQPGDDGAGG